jgi:hypothetical protein
MPAAYRSSKFVDEKVLGSEPTRVTSRIEMMHAYNWYAHFFSSEDAKRFALDYAAGFLSSHDLEIYRKSEDWKTTVNMGATARMLLRGIAYANEFEGRLQSQIRAIVAKETTAILAAPPSPRTNTFLANLEDCLDEFYRSDYKMQFDFAAFVKDENPPKWQLRAALLHYQALSRELQDPSANEGYARLKRARLRRYIDFIGTMLDAIEGVLEERKAQKPRKPRRKKAAKAIKIDGLKFKVEDAALGVRSIDPLNIHGSSEVLIFNLKNNLLTRLLAEPGKQLSIKGTTITNVDKTKSIAKRVKRDKAIFQKLLKATTKTAMAKEMKSISGKPCVVTGRTNPEVLILMSMK